MRPAHFRSRRRLTLLAATATLLLAPIATAQDQERVGDDPLMQALVAELDRSMENLREKEDEPLYYLSYRVTDEHSFSIAASYGVLRDIVALGDDPTLVNTQQFGQLVSVVAPSVLVSELEMRRPREEHQKPPYSTRPEMK